jgi:hypothetical protein
VGHEVGNNIAMVCSLRELEWGKGEMRGWDSCNKEMHERRCWQEKKREGVRYGDEGKNRELTSVPGKEGHTMQGGKASAAPCRGHASTAHVGPTTDGVPRIRSDNDPANVGRSPDTGATPHRCSNYSRLLFPVALLPLFPFESNLHQPFA